MKKISTPVVIKNNKIDSLISNKNKSIIAFQHNNLIEAKYSMTLQQKRVMLWLTSQIQPDDVDFKEHTLSIRELIDICQLSGESAYKELKDVTFGLIQKGIRIIDLSDPKREKEIQVAWLSGAKYHDGRVNLIFSPYLKPYLLQLKAKFTAINMVDMMQFKSIHAIRMYELLKQYQDLGERTLSIEEIKDCCGVKEKLKQYSNFENKLLLIAQREINEKSDIQFDFERIKHSRKIVAIKFIISKNKSYNSGTGDAKEIEDQRRKPPLYDTLREFGLTAKVTNEMLKENDHEDIQNAVRTVDIQISRGNVRNAKAMLLTAIKERWHPDRYKVK